MIAPVFGRRTKPPKPVSGLRAETLVGMTGDITEALGDAGGALWRVDPRAERPDVIAFDTGRATGWATLSGLAGHRSGEISAPAGIDRAFAVRVGSRLDAFALNAPNPVVSAANTVIGRTPGTPKLVVVEDCFLLRNVAAMSGLARMVGAITALAALRGLPVWRVQPHAWQGALLGGNRRREQGKILSLARARAQFGAHIATDHEADASLLALYARGGFVRAKKRGEA